MKKLLFFFIALLTIVSCKYDDLWIKDEFAEIKDKIQRLETLCNELNSDIQSLEQIINALKDHEFITDMQPVYEDGVEVGYKIFFESGKEITIYHGVQGPAGEDGYVPSISVKQDEDGEWYWTIDGEWMLDKDGNKVSTTGRTDLSPKLKIEEMYWYVSYDGGKTWTKLGKATGEDGESFFESVTYDDEYVYIKLADGTSLTLPKASQFSLELEVSGDIPCVPGGVITIPYVLKGAGDSADVITISDGDWIAEVNKTSSTEGSIVITAPMDVTKGQVVVIATNNVKTVVKSLTFTAGVFTVGESFVLADEGGELEMNISTNYDYEVSVDAAWISYVETKAVREETVVFSYEALPEGVSSRTATIKFVDQFCGVLRSIDVTQGSLVSLDKNEVIMFVDEELHLEANVAIPDQELVWTSSDSDVAWVSQEGKVVALSKGTAVIKVMTSDYKYSATCTVTVAEISDYIYLKANGAYNVSYSDGMVNAGTMLTWLMYNESSSDIYVKYLQIVDAYGAEGNKMQVNDTIVAGDYSGWTITLGGSIKAPKLKAVYEYNGKEFSTICGHMFN
jgi:hypothetical protein